MQRTAYFLKTTKDVAKTEVSRNAQLLIRAGMVNQLMAGAYSYLPLGLRVLTKIENIIRDEMNRLGAGELLMPALQPREIWDVTGRWDKIDVLFKLKGAGDRDLALGPTHEEVITPLAATVINSYRDLPTAVYQVQTKFRNEARAKSGLLRGREFRMKDMYSFHATQEDLDAFYEKATEAYQRIYQRVGLGDLTLRTFASGGAFSKYSHEFQTLTESGEDIVYKLPNGDAINEEIITEREAIADLIPNYKEGDEAKLQKAKSIEVGNIFKLGTRFSEAFNLTYTDKDGSVKHPVMGCYGVGPSRVMGTVAEVLSDEAGLIWPMEIAPFHVGIVNLRVSDDGCNIATAKLNDILTAQGFEVLVDDRDTGAGDKFADMDLIGLPWQATIGPKGVAAGEVEWKNRKTGQKQSLPMGKLPEGLSL
ncbi:MAG TPA: aminoacyl--tRNA ligase-related protein [Alphaproteobacteria bacterium]|nr:aminoacyl--tRNA ligase-related protein [Alphaproteobacteria bacterium]